MKFYYLIHFQYLGFRYHGWQKQTNLKTIQQSIEENLSVYLDHSNFKILGASRTDSMVSANHSVFELISELEVNESCFVNNFNQYLPADIKVLKIEKVDRHFKIINGPKVKEYLYLFSFGEKNHPFAAPFMTHINESLDLALMEKAAKTFEGTHSFKNFCYRARENQKFERTIILSEVIENSLITASFFPEKSFIFRIQAESFMRYQVRMMMGAVMQVGMRKLSIEQLKKVLDLEDYFELMIAPASGLSLNNISL